jgi:hypothetical protein
MTHLRWIKASVAIAVAGVALTATGDERAAGADRPTAEFHFTRLLYSDRRRYGFGRGAWGGGSWRVDYPEAEYHFHKGLSRLTRVDTGADARILKLSNDAIFDYPWLYAVEVGDWYLDETETRQLREYLLRGGFLMVDDFHGSQEWLGFTETLKQVFPDRPVLEIPDDDEVLHVLYDLDKRTQVYGIRPMMMGMTYEYDGDEPHWRGVYDDDGRLMIAINHNMDLGDAWEHADTPQYPEPLTALAYRFAVNYVVYAMTH